MNKINLLKDIDLENNESEFHGVKFTDKIYYIYDDIKFNLEQLPSTILKSGLKKGIEDLIFNYNYKFPKLNLDHLKTPIVSTLILAQLGIAGNFINSNIKAEKQYFKKQLIKENNNKNENKVVLAYEKFLNLKYEMLNDEKLIEYSKYEDFGSKYSLDHLIKHSKKIYSKYDKTINEASKTFDIPLEIILGLIGRETADENTPSGTGAFGIMQLVDGAVDSTLLYVYNNKLKESNLYQYSTKYVRQNKYNKQNIIKEIVKNPKLNIETGVGYLDYLKTLFNDDLVFGIIAYKDGLKNMGQYLEYMNESDSKINYNRQLVTQKKFYSENIKDFLINNEICMSEMLKKPEFVKKLDKLKKYNKKRNILLSGDIYLSDVYSIGREFYIEKKYNQMTLASNE